jgi:hypothetical protein
LVAAGYSLQAKNDVLELIEKALEKLKNKTK